MGLEKAIFAKLSTTVAVTAVVSTRIFPMLSPNQQSYPVLIYEITDTEPTMNATGAISSTESKVDIVAVATTYDAAISLADKVKTALDAQSGTWGTVKVIGCFYEGEDDDVVTITDASEVKYVLKTVSFTFFH